MPLFMLPSQPCRYGSTVIEELDPEEGSEEHSEAVTHERVEAWQEAALKLVSRAFAIMSAWHGLTACRGLAAC
jgi:hypothetical protein